MAAAPATAAPATAAPATATEAKSLTEGNPMEYDEDIRGEGGVEVRNKRQKREG